MEMHIAETDRNPESSLRTSLRIKHFSSVLKAPHQRQMLAINWKKDFEGDKNSGLTALLIGRENKFEISESIQNLADVLRYV